METLKAAVIGRTGRGDYGHGLDEVWNDLPGVKLVAVADDDKAGLANCYAPAEDREEFIGNAVAMVLDIFVRDFPEESQKYLSGRKADTKKDSKRK